MIPKIIHYCWFGRKPLPNLAKKCIDSWKKYLPNYEIKEWNEENFDVNMIPYIKEAYNEKKYAFVSDYARFWILYNYGGVYFDTDVELIKPIDDILQKGAFIACELDGINVSVAPGLGISCNPGLDIYKEFVDGYKNRKFIKDDGTLDKTTICVYTTNILKKHGLQNINTIQKVEDIYVYPKEYFNPFDFETRLVKTTKNTRSIHHYASTWETPYARNRARLYSMFSKLFGEKISLFIRKLIGRNK